jgi:sterol desaturase/sphingolipid hydroxylase (fatty acid hydroxylase superfamily)
MSPDILTYAELKSMLPPIIHYAAPVMFGLVGLEFLINQYQQRSRYIGKEFFAASAIGIGNLVVTAIIKAALFGFVLFFLNLVPWRIPPEWWSYPLCLAAIDFCRYWAHRIAHEQRFWWATHVTHHSSVNYNFLVSFRLSWVQHIKVIFFLPAVMIGFDPVVFFICHQIAVLYQFWIHTEYIRKMPAWFEFFFTTPSHHRVHHAINPHYLDKNYGSTFIIWDRIFGTFQPEDEQPIYGITEPVNTYNPVTLVFHEFVDMVRDLRRSKSLKEAWLMVFGRPSQMKAIKARYGRVPEEAPTPAS